MPTNQTKNEHEEINEPEEDQEEFVRPELDHEALNIRLVTLKKAYTFLKDFSKTANVTVSAKAAKISRRVIYQLKNTSPEFKEAFERAEDYAADELSAVVHERAIDKKDDKSHLLLMFALNRYDKKREKKTDGNLGFLDAFMRYVDKRAEHLDTLDQEDEEAVDNA
jgi:hypothetical protein